MNQQNQLCLVTRVMSFPVLPDEWSSQMLLSDSCVVSELPVLPSARLNPPSPDGDLVRLFLVVPVRRLPADAAG